MTEQEHKELVRLEEEGKVCLGVDRVFARRFYTQTPLRLIEAEIGEAPHFEKMVVYTAFVGAPVLVLAMAGFSILYFGWWSLLIVPLAVLLWGWYQSLSCMGEVRFLWISLLLAAAVGVYVSGVVSRRVSLVALLFVGALWMSRLLYISSTFFLRAVVVRNYKAFLWLRDQIIVRHF